MAKKINTGTNPSETEIAALAYQLFEQEGRPHGRDMEHWLEAELLLKSQASNKPVAPPNNKPQPKNTTNSVSNSRTSNSLASLTR